MTVTFNIRPSQIRQGSRAMYAEHPIPGAQHSAIQHMGAKSKIWGFKWFQYDLAYVTATGAGEPRDVVAIIEAWADAGTTVVFVYDYITQALGEAAGIDVKIQRCRFDEIPGTEETYDIEIEVIRFIGANP